MTVFRTEHGIVTRAHSQWLNFSSNLSPEFMRDDSAWRSPSPPPGGRQASDSRSGLASPLELSGRYAGHAGSFRTACPRHDSADGPPGWFQVSRPPHCFPPCRASPAASRHAAEFAHQPARPAVCQSAESRAMTDVDRVGELAPGSVRRLDDVGAICSPRRKDLYCTGYYPALMLCIRRHAARSC